MNDAKGKKSKKLLNNPIFNIRSLEGALTFIYD